MHFTDWLTSPPQMNGQFRDLARDAACDTSFPRKDPVSLTRLLEHIGTYGPARRMLRRAWAVHRAETSPEAEDLAGVLLLDENELAIVVDSLEDYRRRARTEDDDLESDRDERNGDLLEKISRS